MKTIRLSHASYEAIANVSFLPFRWKGDRLPDGCWSVLIEDETYERLERIRMRGETDDDLLMRLVRLYRGQRPS